MKINISIEEQHMLCDALYMAEKEAIDSALSCAKNGDGEGCTRDTLIADTLGKLSSKIYSARDLA